MANNRPGRNEPCHCGSGKKYKNCCWELDELVGNSESTFDRCNAIIMQCKMRLEREYESSIRKYRHDFLNHFLYHTVEQKLPEAQETFYSDWVWFDLLDEDETTLAYDYLNRNAELMPHPLRDCMASLSLSCLSVYQIIGSRPLQLALRDLFSGREFMAELQEDFDLPVTSDLLLFGRVIFLHDAAIFSGMVLVINDHNGVGDFIRDHVSFLQAEMGGMNLAETLKFQGHKLFGIFDHASKGRYLAMNDMRRAELSNDEVQALRQWLDSDDAYQQELSHAEIDWYFPKDSTGFVALGLGADQFLLCCDLLQELNLRQEQLSSLIPAEKLLPFHNNLLGLRPPEELSELWYEATKLRESERWLQTPYPELDGKTPAELRQSPEGQQRLHQLLDELAARAEETGNSVELIQYLRLRAQI